MGATGSTTLDFGSAPGSSYATATVTGQTAITGTSKAEAFLMSEASADHNDIEHQLLSRYFGLTCGNIVAGTGFTVYAVTDMRLTGTVKVNWVWV